MSLSPAPHTHATPARALSTDALSTSAEHARPRRLDARAWLSPVPRLVLAVLLLVALAAAALLPAGRAPLLGAPQVGANGVPTIVQLSYIEGLSNWGPTEARGEIELVFAEGFVRLSADGLPPLTTQRYQGWIVNSETNDAISVGRFNANVDGEVLYEGALPPIADFGFDLFIITVEPEPDDVPQPSTDRSIGGRFSLIGLPAADGSSALDTSTAGIQNPAAGGDAASGLPQELPNTGDATLVTDVARVGALLAAIGLSVVIAFRMSRRPAREGG